MMPILHWNIKSYPTNAFPHSSILDFTYKSLALTSTTNLEFAFAARQQWGRTLDDIVVFIRSLLAFAFGFLS